MEIGLFEFIILLVLIISVTEAGIKILGPVSSKLAELMAEAAREKRQMRKGPEPAPELPAAAVEALEERLARIEERLDFIEELRAPAETRLLR